MGVKTLFVTVFPAKLHALLSNQSWCYFRPIPCNIPGGDCVWLALFSEGEEEQPMQIQGFADDEPLIVA